MNYETWKALLTHDSFYNTVCCRAIVIVIVSVVCCVVHLFSTKIKYSVKSVTMLHTQSINDKIQFKLTPLTPYYDDTVLECYLTKDRREKDLADFIDFMEFSSFSRPDANSEGETVPFPVLAFEEVPP